MNANILASRERKIERMIEQTGCSRDYAISYLYSEGWIVADAVFYYNLEKQFKQGE